MQEREPSLWAREAHERRVAAFYGTGLDRLDEDQNWELTYGLWKTESDTYAQAALNMWEELFARLDLVPEESVVVDVAPGMGKELVHLYEKYRPRKIVAVDITPQHVARARRLVESHGLSDRIQVITGSGTELTKHFARGFATHVICVEGTVQMKHRVEFFRTAREILRPFGVLGICDSTLRRPSGRWTPLVRLVVDAWKVPPENILSAAQVAAQLESLGFTTMRREVGERVWAPYCRAKRREIRADIQRRGLAKGLGLAIINQLIAWADRAGVMGYTIFIGRT